MQPTVPWKTFTFAMSRIQNKQNLIVKIKINFAFYQLEDVEFIYDNCHGQFFLSTLYRSTTLPVKRQRIQRVRVDCANSSSLLCLQIDVRIDSSKGGTTEWRRGSSLDTWRIRKSPEGTKDSSPLFNRVPEHVDVQSSSVFRDIPWPLFALISSGQRWPIVVSDARSLQGLKHLRKTLVYPFRQ